MDQGPFAYDATKPLSVIDRGVVDGDYPIAVHDVSYTSGDDTVEALPGGPDPGRHESRELSTSTAPAVTESP